MAKETLYAYVDAGPRADLETVVEMIERRLDELVATRKWVSSDVWVVNQREAGVHFVHWDLGLNLALPAKRKSSGGWFDDVLAITEATVALQRETGRTFVIGVSDERTGETKDLLFVRDGTLDLAKLRAALES
jgi:hypothetical protein